MKRRKINKAKISFGGTKKAPLYEFHILRDKKDVEEINGLPCQGPALVYVSNNTYCQTVEYHIDDQKTWDWLGALSGIGVWAMDNPEINKLIPEELKEHWKIKS